jgi:hypothetical protein
MLAMTPSEARWAAALCLALLLTPIVIYVIGRIRGK